MIVYVLFVHKKSVAKRKVCIIFIRNKKFKKTRRKTKQKTFFVGFLGVFCFVFLGGFFWVGFLGGFFYYQPWEQAMVNAWDGCAASAVAPVHKSAALFFYANKKTCQA
jgi:hypothetical protein